MKWVSSKSKEIFISSRSRQVFISLFNTSTSSSSSSSSSINYPSASRRYDEVSKSVRVSVWWDIENCSVPNGVNAFKITQSITSAVRANGIKGPVQVTAFGDIFCLSRPNQEALSSTGVNLVHVPQGGKNSADRSLLVDLMYWVSQNPPPAHIFLISGDRDFAGILHKLRMNNYNILLSGNDSKNTPGVLCSAASIMWHWNELTKGINLSGRHFNHPPDGPFNSWYGHFKTHLEDPFHAPEPPAAPDHSHFSPERRPVPLSVLRQIRRIISAFPNGTYISELRAELSKNKVPIDNKFFGYKKFSRFLQSIPHIVEVQDNYVDNQLYVRPASRKLKKNYTSVESFTDNQNQDVEDTTTANSHTHTPTKMMDFDDTTQTTVDDMSTNETPNEDLTDAQVAFDKELQGKRSGVMDSGSFKEPNSKILCTKLFGPKTDADKRAEFDDDYCAGNPEMSHSSSSNDSNNQPLHPSSGVAFNSSDDSEVSPGFITRVISWCKSWKNSFVNTPTEQSTEESGLIGGNSKKLDDASHSKKLDDASHSKKHELFSNDTFWNALHSFFKTRRGSDIVLNSTSREQFAKKLQKEGPLVLRPFQETDLHHLVDLLVSEKKWIVEFPAKIPRFRIAQTPVESSVEFQPSNAQLHRSNGLSSLFMSSSAEGNHQSKVSSTLPKKPSEKSRNEVLADCQKLLDELILLYPDGFNMRSFKKLFLEKYGYSLDHQKLGYPKLVSLLHIMPGVKVESSYVYSDKAVCSTGFESLGPTEMMSGSDSDASDSPRKNEDGESPWEELGPVAKQERELTIGQVNGKYEPSISDDDEFSESEEVDATSSFAKEEDQNSSRAYEEESSLLQILDSWYSNKDESNPQDLGTEGLVDCSKQEPGSSQPSNSGIEGAAASASAANHALKLRPQKRYLFVSDPIETKKEKLIDGILGSLKKSGESRMQE